MKRKAKTAEPGRLLDRWRPPDGAGKPIGCVATTFTFDAPFFETQCLARFAEFETDADEAARTYIIEREERLSQIFACVIVDRLHSPAHRSLRWHVLPVGLRAGGILHAKVAILRWENRVRVLVGSANLTEPAYRRNLEHVAAFEFGPASSMSRTLLLDVVSFVGEVAELSAAGPEDQPKRELRAFLDGVRDAASAWPAPGASRGGPSATFAPVWPGRTSLFAAIDAAWRGARPDRATVLSPFYDEGDGALETVGALAGLLTQRGDRNAQICAPGIRLADGVVELHLPECLRTSPSRRLALEHYLVPEAQGEDGSIRPLHAKSIWLERDDLQVFTIGSSNFTRAGTGIGTHTNVEANVIYVLPEVEGAFARKCLETLPKTELLDLGEENVVFLSSDHTDAQADEVPLPLAFGAARFDPAPAPGRLLLDIAEPPDDFIILTDERVQLLISTEWLAAGRSSSVVVAWHAQRPPSYLVVRWRDGAGVEREAVWPVNVTDAAQLPPPEELRGLQLDDLLAVLTSATPAYETLARLAERRASGRLVAADVVVDPHGKVDTSKHLLRRMRRVARALEGLRERLEMPVHRLESLRWRLFGPFGPVALARQLAAEEGDGAAFLVTEVALTVHAATVRGGADIHPAVIVAEKAVVIAQLEELARERPGPENLARYVRDSFGEMTP